MTESKQRYPMLMPIISLAITMVAGIVWITSELVLIRSTKNALKQQQTAIQKLQNELQKQSTVKNLDGKIIIIKHLVRMADLTLNTSRDIKTALEFLLTAKKYATDPEEPSITHALDKDIANLQAVPVVNQEELIFKIEAMQKQIETLPLIPTKITMSTKTADETPQNLRQLNQFLANVVKALKDIIIIRHHTIEPALSPEQEIAVRLNIQTRLLQTEIAIMQKQDKLYQTCLADVINLVNKHFILNHAVTSNILKILQGLQSINLQPLAPSPISSLTAI